MFVFPIPTLLALDGGLEALDHASGLTVRVGWTRIHDFGVLVFP